MNAFITVTLLAAAVSACPEFPPMECGSEEMMCPGGVDPEGCQMPDLCMPGIWARDDVQCPSFCPIFCGPDEMMCLGVMDPEGCPMPDFCMPIGTECPPM